MNTVPTTADTLDEVLDHIRQTAAMRRLDYVASVTSGWHALGVSAYLYGRAKALGVKQHGVVIINRHTKSGFVCSPADFLETDAFEPMFVFHTGQGHPHGVVDSVRAYLKVLTNVAYNARASRSELVFISPRLPNLGLLKLYMEPPLSLHRLRFVLVDEGIGTYMPDKIWKITKELDRPPGRKSSRRVVATELGAYLVRRIVLALTTVESQYLFDTKAELTPRPGVLASYREVLNGSLAKHKVGRKPQVLIVTQPWVEYDQVDEEAYLQLIRTVICELSDAGFGVMLKPHPREDSRRYMQIADLDGRPARLVDDRRVVERLLGHLRPACIVGFTSTALVAAKALYGIPAFTVVEDVINTLETGPMLKASAKQFSRTFRSLVAGSAELRQWMYEEGSRNATAIP